MQCRKCFESYQPAEDAEAPFYCACPHVISGDVVFFERGGPQGIDTLYCKTCAVVLKQRWATGAFEGDKDGDAEIDLIRPVCKPDWEILRKQRAN